LFLAKNMLTKIVSCIILFALVVFLTAIYHREYFVFGNTSNRESAQVRIESVYVGLLR
jgi:hypothetical protein